MALKRLQYTLFRNEDDGSYSVIPDQQYEYYIQTHRKRGVIVKPLVTGNNCGELMQIAFEEWVIIWTVYHLNYIVRDSSMHDFQYRNCLN